MDMKMVARVLAEATLLSYDAQRVASDAAELLADTRQFASALAALDAEEKQLRGQKRRIRESHNAGLYESEREMRGAVAEVDAQLASISERRNRVKADEERLTSVTVDPAELRRRVESSQEELLALARTVMEGYILLPTFSGRYEERVAIQWKPGCDPGPTAMQALCDELRRRRIHKRAVTNAAMQPHAVPPEVGALMWRLHKEGLYPLAIARRLRELGFTLPSKQPAGKGRNAADSGFVTRELKRQAGARNETYRTNHLRKYSDEIRTVVYELSRDGKTFPEICDLLDASVKHPDGRKWEPTMVRSLYAHECARLGSKPLGRRPALNAELRSLLWAKAQSGMTRPELADFLNKSNVIRPGRKPWDVPSVANVLRAERRRLETEGVLPRRELRVPPEVPRRMLEMHRQNMTLAAIAEWATAHCIPRRKDAPWDTVAVSNALQRARADEGTASAQPS